MPSPGRPPLEASKRRTAPVPVRFTEAERDLIESAAQADEQSVSAWVRDRALAAAKRRAHRRRADD
jgi:uncharacterized protein (DUF1778 family)